MSAVVSLVLARGGLTLVAIALVSVVALAVVIERSWRLLPLRARFTATHARAQAALLGAGAGAGGPLTVGDDAMGRVIAAALSVRHRGHEVMRVVALDAAQREVPALERGLGVLLVSAQVAPLLGLLGTVVGLIEAFQAAATATSVTPAVLADGLYKALGTTVAGLWVAIPSFIAYGGFSSLAGRLCDQLEHAATGLPLLVEAPPVPPR